MRQRLIQYVELLFAGAPGTEDIKQEILQNTLDRFDDLISQGKTEEAAYRLAISGIGDINEILGDHVHPSPAPAQGHPAAKNIPQENRKSSSNAVVRIILISLSVLILGSLLFIALGIGIFSVFRTSSDVRYDTQVMESGTSQAVETDASKISGLEIVWAAGNIRIEPSPDVTTIQVNESEVADKYKMVCKVSDGTLKIQFSKESIKFPSFGLDTVAKDLVITVPSDWLCRELDIDAAAANVTIRDLTIGELDFDGASGICDLENCHVTSMDVDAASGSLNFSGILDNLDFDGASADCTLALKQCPRRIELDGVSGKMDITLPSDCGFTVESQGLNSGFSTDFETISRNGSYIFGDGSCHIRLEALSGDLTIHNGGYTCHDGQESHNSNHH